MAESSSSLDGAMDESTETETVNVGYVRTILNSLKSPAPSELTRKRKTHSNPPSGMKRRTTIIKAVYEPKSITPTGRDCEFAGENLTVSSRNLFCSACREPLSLKKSIIKLHLDSQKQKSNCLLRKQSREVSQNHWPSMTKKIILKVKHYLKISVSIE